MDPHVSKPMLKTFLSLRMLLLTAMLSLLPSLCLAAVGMVNDVPAIFGIRIEFILFALALVGVALFHRHTMYVALIGLGSILAFKFLFVGGFTLLGHLLGHGQEEGEWRILLNLLGLLLGFAILARHFEESRLPDNLPNFLPDGWKGGFVLLLMIAVLSSFLDNIAAAMIGGAIARIVFKGKIAYRLPGRDRGRIQRRRVRQRGGGYNDHPHVD